MHRRHFLRVIAAVALAGVAWADGPKTPAGAEAVTKRQRLEREIAALEARMRAVRPEFEREQHAWEAEVLQHAGAAGTKEPKAPPRILAILALEPTEREPAQREEVAAFFLPLSKTLGDLSRQLAAKRAALAALPPFRPQPAPVRGAVAAAREKMPLPPMIRVRRNRAVALHP